MKDIIIKSDKNSEFLRTEALTHAIFYEAHVIPDENPKIGKSHGTIYTKYANTSTTVYWNFLVYLTKKAIVVEISYCSKNKNSI